MVSILSQPDLNNEEFTNIKNHLSTTLKNIKKENLIKDINPRNLVILLTYTMETIEKVKQSSKGFSKKQLALHVLKQIIIESSVPSENKSYMIYLLNDVFDPMVENIIDVSKGKFDINKGKKLLKKVFSCFCKNKTL